jgi:hypothetical protein
MFGFLVAGALAGLATLAWPIYLHVRRRQRLVQSVPSLRLFRQTRLQRKRIHLQQVLLLLCRVVLLAALCLLVAQPFVRSPRPLPLPLAAGEAQPAPTLALLVDDSLAAAEGDAGGSRLAQARAWLLPQLAAQSPGTRVRLATTTCPFPSPPLALADAVAAVEALAPLPQEGDAPQALARLVATVAGQTGCLLVVAPRQSSLWRGLAAEPDAAPGMALHWLDTTTWQNPCYLRRVEPGPSAGGGTSLLCQLGGPREELPGHTILAWQDEQELARVTITPHDALRGAAVLPLPPTPPGSVLRVRVQAAYEHPWLTWYQSAEAAQATAQRVALIRPPTPAGLAADHLLTALLQAVAPQLALDHLDAQQPPAQELSAAGAVIWVGAAPGPAWAAWLEQQFSAATRVLCVPLPDSAAVAGAPHPTWFPAWRAVREVAGERQSLRVTRPDDPGAPALDALLLAGLAELPYRLLAELAPAPGTQPLLVDGQGSPLLTWTRVGPAAGVVATAWPLELSAGSPVFHPAFPLLVRQLLLATAGTARAPGQAPEVGTAVELAAWFGRTELAGTLVLPDGGRLPVAATPAQPQYLPLDQAGVYRVELAHAELRQAANVRRPADDAIFTAEEWAAAHPDLPIRWLTPTDGLTPASYQRLGAGAAADALAYDLTPVAVALFLLAALGEVVLLWLAWRHDRQ